jgi:phosphoribosylformylglycinamidine cyclo-ligase
VLCLKYSSFVDYGKLNPVKLKALQNFKKTFASLRKHGVRVVPESIGHTAAVLDFKNAPFMLAFNLEGLGTKSLIADKLAITKKSKFSTQKLKKFYENLAFDCVASTVNDLIAVGAQPLILADMIAASNNELMETKFGMPGLLSGFKKAALKFGFAIPCGETPVYPNLLVRNAIDLSAASLGIIQPKKRVVLGKKLKAGDRIFAFASNGLHTNGLTLARKIVEKLPKKYLAKTKTTKTIAEEILKPSHIYANLVAKMLKAKIKIHYMNPITGHGFQKIMRPKKSFTYVIEHVPKKQEVFRFLQQKGNVSDEEAYKTWNMGVGFVVFAPKSEAKKIER